jgi:hypothetical protein
MLLLLAALFFSILLQCGLRSPPVLTLLVSPIRDTANQKMTKEYRQAVS